MTTLLDLVRTGEDDRGPLAVADASLWVDGTKIYEARGLAMRVVRDTTRGRQPAVMSAKKSSTQPSTPGSGITARPGRCRPCR